MGLLISYANDRQSYPISGLDGPLGLQNVEAPRMSRKLADEGVQVVGPRHRPPVSHEIFLVLFSVRD